MAKVYDTDVMKPELYDFDVFPMAFLVSEEKEITIKQLGIHRKFEGFIKGHTYYIKILETEKSEEKRFPGTNGFIDLEVCASEDGYIKVCAPFAREGRYFIQLFSDAERTKKVATFCVYALGEDMKGKYPYRGDLHMHTSRSDGYDAPEIVAANYRGHGYDFTVISDHHRYYPSLEAREKLKFKGDKSEITDMLIVRGEEVHLPFNDIHTVNFGGDFSINAIVPDSHNYSDNEKVQPRGDKGVELPKQMTNEEFEKMARELAKEVPSELTIESERLSFAIEKWIYEMIKKANGLCIFAHPHWLWTTMQVSEDYLRFIYEQKPFDAFEVLGGENYYQHNGFQTAFYYEMKSKGMNYPIVGSTDSHRSTKINADALICSTIVFAKENTTQSIIEGIKEGFSVAVDTISPEYGLVGDYRLIKYASFLMENWYPLHDKATQVEGYYLKQYVTGDKDAEKVLMTIKGQVPKMLKKYFDM